MVSVRTLPLGAWDGVRYFIVWYSLGLPYNYFGVVGTSMGYIDSSDSIAWFCSNSDFTETVDMCKRSINIGVSQTEDIMMQMKTTDYTQEQ